MTTTDSATADRPSRIQVRLGWGLTALVTLFLLFDSATKLMRLPFVVDATVKVGFPAYQVPLIGALLLVCLVAYLIPRTSVFGAVLLTAYLGGAVCTNLRLELPLFGFILAPVYTAVIIWLGLYLRSAALRRLVRTGY